ncbi:uncharacterized protein LOC129807589 [Phlebotomus papatasi]|uniref:uncharacterized protein LOC129807589 n=1 Tax=Phlebotomus papatasi TaxID=29031 RepID=UPI0024838BD9|nr:uncharacterized protein LOC129807589 [Phlebotomus papatasi]
MEGLSPEKALLMEIALELLGNTVYDVFGLKQDSLIDLFKDNALSNSNQKNATNMTPTAAAQQSLLRPLPQRVVNQEIQFPKTIPINSMLDQQCWNTEMNSYQKESKSRQFMQSGKNQEFVNTMLKKIETEYNTILKSSTKQKQNYFMDFWMESVNDNKCPDITEEEIAPIAEKFFSMERQNLERQCTEHKNSIINMKKSASSELEVAVIQEITHKIAAVKNRLEQYLLNPHDET